MTWGIERTPRDRIVARAVIRLATDLGMDVVAEGVETAGMLEMLSEWGCAQAQGWHVGRPMVLEDLLERVG